MVQTRFQINRQNRLPRIVPKSPVVKTSSGHRIKPQSSSNFVTRARHVRPQKPKQIRVDPIERPKLPEKPVVVTKRVAPKKPPRISDHIRVSHKRAPGLNQSIISKPKDRLKRLGRSKLAAKMDMQEKIYAQHNSRITRIKDIGIGRVLVMIACGPSTKQAPLEKIIGHKLIDFMIINRAYGFYKNECPEKHQNIWPPKYWVMCDNSQYRRNTSAWSNYKGTIITSASVRERHPNHVIIRHRGGKGFSKDLMKGYYIGRSTTYANMQTALYMSYDRIYIFGIDMNEVDGQLHHYGVNPDVAPKNRKGRFAEEAKHYEFATQSLSKVEMKKFTFCSSYNPFPFVDKYGRLDQKEAPDKILEYLDQR